MSSRGSVDQKTVDKINVLFKPKDSSSPAKKATRHTEADDELKAFVDFVDKKGTQNIDTYHFTKSS